MTDKTANPFLDENGRFLTIREIEALAIRRALEWSNGKRDLAAEILEMPRATFYDRLRRYGLRKSAGMPKKRKLTPRTGARA